MNIDQIIVELLKREPFWNRCYPCSFHGACCVGAVIDPLPEEQAAINAYLKSQPEATSEIIRCHASAGRQCKYRAEDRCLIHDVRPSICRYTPFWAGGTTDRILTYWKVQTDTTGACTQERCKRLLTNDEAEIMLTSPFIPLDNFGRKTLYLSLPWLSNNGVIRLP